MRQVPKAQLALKCSCYSSCMSSTFATLQYELWSFLYCKQLKFGRRPGMDAGG